MKVLILGAAGQVGSEIIAALEDAAVKGAPPDKASALALDHGLQVFGATRQSLDVTDVVSLNAAVRDLSPDWIINATAYTAVDRAESEPDLARLINAATPGALAEICQLVSARLLHISTDYVFSGDGNQPFTEAHDTEPLGVYGSSKLAGETAIRSALHEHIILRTAWVFGPQGNNFVKTMLKLAESRDEVSVVDDQVGAPTSARSIADAIATIVIDMACADGADDRWGTYHYSGYPYTSWAGFADEIFSAARDLGIISSPPSVRPIGTSEYPTPAVRPGNSRLDCTKINDIFGIKPDDWLTSLRPVLFALQSAERG